MEPKTREEKRIFKDCCIASYRAELIEIQEFAPNVDGFFYSEHLGFWILQFKVGEDQEFETKEEMMEWIKSEGQD